MRLGDLDALKEEMKKNVPYYEQDRIIEIIDNAPTVEPEPYFEKAEKDKRIYEQGFKDGQNTRPQGKWIMITEFDGFIHAKCSICNQFNDWGDVAFCPWCGADMRGKEE